MNSKSSNKSSKKKNQHQHFLVNYALRMLLTMMMQFYVTPIKHGSTLNVIILIALTTNIYRVVVSHGIASLVSCINTLCIYIFTFQKINVNVKKFWKSFSNICFHVHAICWVKPCYLSLSYPF